MKSTNNNISQTLHNLSSMRTSNKILLGLFLAAVLLFTSLFAAVRIKYANRDFVKASQTENTWSVTHALNSPIKRVDLTNLGNIMIIPADTARLELWKQNEGMLKWRLQDGVLTILPDTTVPLGSEGRAWGHVELFLPAVDSIYASNTNLVIKNVADSGAQQPVYNIELDLSDLALDNNSRIKGHTYYDKLRVNARNRSSVKLRRDIRVNDLDARLLNTKLEDEGASLGRISLQTDSISTITLKGESLRKAIITSTE